MRFVALLAAGMIVGVGTTNLKAQGLGTGIATPKSPHNFVDNIGGEDDRTIDEIGTGTGWNEHRQEICRVCHVPHDHGRTQNYGDVLLWNHELSTASYTMYTSPTLDGTADAQPTGHSKLCLGCHDGTVNLDAFDKGAGTGITIDTYEAGFKVPGNNHTGNLQHTHPISIEYNETKDTGLQPKTATMGGSGTIADVLEGGKVQCSSCHDVHDQAGESVPGTHLLRVATKAPTASGLCLTCHIK